MAHLWIYKSCPRAHTPSRYDRRSRTRPSQDLVQPRNWNDLKAIYGTVLVLSHDGLIHETHPDDPGATHCGGFNLGRMFLKGKITCMTCLAKTAR